MICCPYCGKTNILPPAKPFSKLELRPIRTGVVCSNCGKKFGYWKRLETRAHRNREGVLARRLCTYLKIAEIASDHITDTSLRACCSICGNELSLSAPKPMSKLKLRPIRSDALCSVCAGSFMYWGRLEARKPHEPEIKARRYCIYFKIPSLEEQQELYQHRVETEKRWFNTPPVI